MDYDPSVAAVYEQYTGMSDWDDDPLRGCRRETVVSAIYELGREYDGLRASLEPTRDTERYGYVDDGEPRPRLEARILLSRYLSAVYRLVEAIRVCLSMAADEPLERIRLYPPMHSDRSRWHPNTGGGQPWADACDEVMTRLTYLRGLRNAVVHGTNDGFDARRDSATGLIVCSVNPSAFDRDPALHGSRVGSADYSFSDTYFRFERSREEAVYPLDNVVCYHEDVLFPFVRAFEDEL